MKNKSVIFSVLLVGVLLLFLFNCKKEAMKVAPTVTIAEATNVTVNSATVSSTITADGGSEVLSRGVCWNINGNPTISDTKTSDGKGVGSFSSSLTSLSPGTTYNLKSYATNAIGTAYSSQTSFKTLALLATLTTTDASAIASTSVSSGGNITNDGGAAITSRGVCWSTSQNPTIADSKTTDGAGSGIFISAITGLTPGTIYYFRAYAINSIGTSYGNETTITTNVALPSITTISATSIGSTSATLGGNIISNGGGTIAESGIYWGTSQNPETTGTKIKSDVTTNAYSIDLIDLLPNTAYYVKAYATNSKGTNFGNQISFTTAEFKFGIIDVSQTSAWNYWVVAKDGSSYFVTLINNKPSLVYFKPDKNKNGYVIYFDDKGLPSKMVVENYVLLFTNYRSQLVDVAIVSPNNDVTIQRDLKVNIDMSKFFQKSVTSEILFGLGLASDAIGIVSCVSGIAGIASVVGAVPGVLLAAGCASTAIGIASEIFPESFKVAGPAGKVVGYAAGIAGCYNSKLDCVTTAFAEALDIANLANAIIENPNIAEAIKILMQGFTVSTNNIISITANSALVGGSIKVDGVATIIERGVLYSIAPNPQITGTRLQIGSGAGNFSSTLNGLTPDTTYYVIAYAKSTVTTLYGTSVSFKTKAQAKLPTLTTTVATLVTTNSATSGGNIISDGGATITSKGVCWSTIQNPTTSSSKTSNGTGAGTFTSSITGLTPNTTYYIRAWATNSVNTAYGNQVSFKTTCDGVNINFNARMDQGGPILVFGVTGGVAPYKYSINNSAFQSSEVFNGPYSSGSFLIEVKDNNGCTKSELILLPSSDPIIGRWKSTEVWYDQCNGASEPIQGYDYLNIQANYNITDDLVLFGETYGCTGTTWYAGTWRKSNNTYYFTDLDGASELVTISSDGKTLCYSYDFKGISYPVCWTKE